jgi:hypothetical protein
MVTMGNFPFKEKFPWQNPTWDLMISSQKLCPLDHEAGLSLNMIKKDRNVKEL